MAKLPLGEKACLFISASLLFPSPLMHAGRDKGVGNVQLLAEVPRLRQCVVGKNKLFHYLSSLFLALPLTLRDVKKKCLRALGRAVGVKLPGTCASLGIPL